MSPIATSDTLHVIDHQVNNNDKMTTLLVLPYSGKLPTAVRNIYKSHGLALIRNVHDFLILCPEQEIHRNQKCVMALVLADIAKIIKVKTQN